MMEHIPHTVQIDCELFKSRLAALSLSQSLIHVGTQWMPNERIKEEKPNKSYFLNKFILSNFLGTVRMKCWVNFYVAFKNSTVIKVLFIIYLWTHRVALGNCMLKLILKFKSKFQYSRFSKANKNLVYFLLTKNVPHPFYHWFYFSLKEKKN